MPQRPIYESEPIPGESGSSSATSGLTHSAYQRARVRQLRQNVESQPVSLPSAPRNRGAVEEGLQTANLSADAVRTHIRKQILNARAPGLGEFIGPLPEKVQGVVDAKAEPLARQVRRYTVKKYTEGTALSPTPTAPKPAKTSPAIKAQMQQDYQVKFPDTRPPKTEKELAAGRQRSANWERQNHLTIMKNNPDWVAVPKGGAQPVAPRGKEYAVAAPQQSHPDVGYHSYYKLVDKPVVTPKVTLAEKNRAERDANKTAQVADAEGPVKRAISDAHALISAQHPEASPNAVRKELEHHIIMGSFPEVSEAHRNFTSTLGQRTPILRHFGAHITSLTEGIKRDDSRQQAIKAENAAPRRQLSEEELQKYAGVNLDEVDLDQASGIAPVRRRSDPAYTKVARQLAKEHWSSTSAGKLAGTVKNELTGELHPTFAQTSHFKNPKAYMKKVMGFSDPDKHIDEAHSEKLRAIDSSQTDYDVIPAGSGKPPQVGAAPFKGFAAKYAANPIGAALTATTKKPVNKPSTVSSRVTAASQAVADLGRAQIETRRISRAGSTDGFNAGRGAQ